MLIYSIYISITNFILPNRSKKLKVGTFFLTLRQNLALTGGFISRFPRCQDPDEDTGRGHHQAEEDGQRDFQRAEAPLPHLHPDEHGGVRKPQRTIRGKSRNYFNALTGQGQEFSHWE